MPNNFAYNINIPDAPNNPSNDQPNMKINTNSISSLIGVDHVGFNTNGSGIHKQVTFQHENNPGLGDGNAVLFATNPAGFLTDPAWPYWNNSTGTPVQMLSGIPISGALGKTFLPGGIILQWGSISGAPIPNNTLVAFTTPFPLNVFSITLGAASNSTNDKTINILTGSVSTSNFRLITSGSSAFQTVYWMAIGN